MDEFEELICREIVELVTNYLDYSMAPDERTLFEEHLVMCEGCRNYLGQVERTVELAGRLGAEDLSESARGELIDAFRDWRAERG